MMLRSILRFATATLLLAICSCAQNGYVANTPSMPAARAALRPEYRVFYDALQDYGDWVLIEPYGFVFRPRVDYASFRPYQDGFWAPSDPWGWVWISAEPFGWATYHYGNWFWDRFQGWVWSPGVDWGPAWVNWEIAGPYAGWAPLPPAGMGYGDVPGGAWIYAPMNQMGATTLSASLMTRAAVGAAAQNARPVVNPIEHDGVHFNGGPSFALIERMRGTPLQKVKIEEAAGSPGALARKAETAAPTPAAGATEPATAEESARAARAAAGDMARQAREMMQKGGAAPDRLPVMHKPALKPDVAAEVRQAKQAQRKAAEGGDRRAKPAPRKAAPADTTR